MSTREEKLIARAKEVISFIQELIDQNKIDQISLENYLEMKFLNKEISKTSIMENEPKPPGFHFGVLIMRYKKINREITIQLDKMEKIISNFFNEKTNKLFDN